MGPVPFVLCPPSQRAPSRLPTARSADESSSDTSEKAGLKSYPAPETASRIFDLDAFITEEEMKRDHAELPHGGQVIRGGTTGKDGGHRHVIEFSLKLDSNPEFTASVLAACARAINRMHSRGINGCKTIFDIAPADLSPMDPADIRKKLL